MEIFEFDKIGSFGSSINMDDLKDITTDGISVRMGNKVVKLSVTEEVILPEDELKKEYDSHLEEAYRTLKTDSDRFKDELKQVYDNKVVKLDEEIQKYKRLSKDTSPMPVITPEQSKIGLSVSKSKEGFYWYFNGVYAPKYVNNRVIETSFAKRLMTPVTILMKTNEDDSIYDVKVLKIIGHEKFRHYHSMSAHSDCWGDFQYGSLKITNAEEAIEIGRKCLLILETINEFSLGTTNPRGLSRFNTIKNHLLDEKKEEEPKKTSTNTRNSRSGFDTNINDDIREEMVWSTDA